MAKDKHLKWKIKMEILDYIDIRGASGIVEDKYINLMLDDAFKLYQKDESESISSVAEKVVDYYLKEMFTYEEELPDEEELVVRDVDEELAKVKKDKDVEEEFGEEDRVTCKICGQRFKVLYPHLLAKHHLKPDQYRTMFPGAKLRAGTTEKIQEGKEKEVKSYTNIHKKIIRLARKIYLSQEVVKNG